MIIKKKLKQMFFKNKIYISDSLIIKKIIMFINLNERYWIINIM